MFPNAITIKKGLIYHLNIADMVNRSRGGYVYTMIDIVDKVNGDTIPGLVEKINQIEGIVTARII